MCLDIDYHYNNQNSLLRAEISENQIQNINHNNITMENSSFDSSLKIKNLCGGTLVKLKPIFDPKGETIYVVRNNFIRVFSIETGEMVTELVENTSGEIVGFHLDPETNKSIISCTNTGELAFWKLDSYIITKRMKLNLKSVSIVKKFLLTSIDNSLHGLVHYYDKNGFSQIVLVDLLKNKVVQQFDLPYMSGKKDLKLKFADGKDFFAIIYKFNLYIIDKTTNDIFVHSSNFILNVVACHPEEQMIATGDVNGRIILWNSFYSRRPIMTFLHWHNMIVLSLEFSQSGTVLYSGGRETVLVKWHIKEKSLDRNFLPRVSAGIQQITVDTIHDRIIISLDDNSLQVINSSLTQLKTIQDFTKVSPYDLGLSLPFQAGIRVNPRNKYLVMNGRTGHLQFFSTKSMKLLFNIDITMKNAAPRTWKVNNCSTDVTHVAVSSQWMATVEMWNDRIASLDSRLKFWKFIDEKQTYKLHTQIEQPHDMKILAIEFSNNQSSTICATAGLDRVIKIWSLEASEEIENPKMIWMQIEQVSYKNLSIRSLNFSQDSSLLCAGIGNSLCVWDTLKFKLKCSLSAPASLDGSVNRVIISLPKSKKKSEDVFGNNTSKIIEKRQKICQMMNSIINDPTQSIVKNMTQEKSRIFKRKSVDTYNSNKLKYNEKKMIFDKILSTPDLTFNEKLQIFQKLNIYYNISNRLEQEVIDYMSRNIAEETHLYSTLKIGVFCIRNDSKYKLLWRSKMWRNLDSKRNRKIITVRKLLKNPMDEEKLKYTETDQKQSLIPIKNLNSITNTIFCKDELSHLVIVSTSNRILIWNLLTLKIQGSFKIHSKFISVDPLTNLIAVFTKFNELFIFHPSPAITLFHQKNMPNIYSTVWIPRENPKLQSLSVNWQAISQLLFINHDQEICTLVSPNDEDSVDLTPFMYEPNEVNYMTPFAAILSQRDISKRANDVSIDFITSNNSGNIKEIINLSNHAMPPISKLSLNFISSLLTTKRKNAAIDDAKHRAEEKDIDTFVVSDDEGDVLTQDEKMLRRKAFEEGEKLLKENIAKKKDADINIENEMKNLKLNEFDGFFITKNEF